jgi:hypothetical protein
MEQLTVLPPVHVVVEVKVTSSRPPPETQLMELRLRSIGASRYLTLLTPETQLDTEQLMSVLDATTAAVTLPVTVPFELSVAV